MVRRYKKKAPSRRRRTQVVAAASALWRNRGSIANAARYATKRFGGKLDSGPAPKRRNTTRGTKSYSTRGFGGNDISYARGTIGRTPKLRPKRLLKLINVGMNSRIEKFQGITNFDTNTGYFTIANREDTTTGVITQPLHVYNLSIFKNTPNAPRPVLANAYGWSGSTGAGTVVRNQLLGMNFSGTATNSDWASEEFAGPSETLGVISEFPTCRKLLHDWTQVKMNLYGARTRPTWFKISFVQVRNEFANFASAGANNERFIELINYLTGSMTFSNLQTRDVSAAKYLKVLKSYKYLIPADLSTDLNTASGKIKEVRLFYKHGRVLNMAPHETRTDAQRLGHAQADGGDFEVNSVPLNTPADAAQVFMIVQAWSPSRHSATTADWATVTTNYTPLASTMWTAAAKPTTAGLDCPSYDIILRQKYSVPS